MPKESIWTLAVMLAYLFVCVFVEISLTHIVPYEWYFKGLVCSIAAVFLAILGYFLYESIERHGRM